MYTITYSGTFPILTYSDTSICSPIHPSVVRYALSYSGTSILAPVHPSVLRYIHPYSGTSICTLKQPPALLFISILGYVYLHFCVQLYIFSYSDKAFGTMVHINIIRYIPLVHPSALQFNLPYLDIFYLFQGTSFCTRVNLSVIQYILSILQYILQYTGSSFCTPAHLLGTVFFQYLFAVNKSK